MVRWIATVWYRHDAHNVDVTHELEELGDLQELIERGPHWDTIAKIEVTRVTLNKTPLTIEQAEKL
ncbi:MAG: hypothetical protein CXT67_09680 [Methanobacteriota archaeon]|nr:MAG: hypothetical protein CXT67_09680 [Euryarchaeota archaeon]